MKIAVICNNYPPFDRGGDATVAYNEVQALAERGHEIHVIFDTTNYYWKSSIEQKFPKNTKNIKYYDLKTKNIYLSYGLAKFAAANPYAHKKILQILLEIKPDIVHCHNVSSMGNAPFAVAQQLNIPSVLTLHDLWWRKKPCMADRIICTSENIRKEYNLTKKYTVLYNAIPKKRTYKKNKDHTRFLFVGELADRKGPLRVIEAFKKLKGSKHLTIIGRGEQAQEIHKYANEHNSKIVFHENAPEDVLTRVYCYADVLVLPSRWESMPMSIIEAMRSGIAIISTVEEIHKTFGQHLKNPDDIKELTSLMQRYIDYPSLLEQDMKHFKWFFNESFSMDAHIKKLEEIYDEVCKK